MVQNKINTQTPVIQKAIADIVDFFTTETSYSQLAEETLENSCKVIDELIRPEGWDGNMSLPNLVFNSKRMILLLKPFAEAIGQNDQMFYDKN